jgi:hypothetical protein
VIAIVARQLFWTQRREDVPAAQRRRPSSSHRQAMRPWFIVTKKFGPSSGAAWREYLA